jgi:hypothetical protein
LVLSLLSSFTSSETEIVEANTQVEEKLKVAKAPQLRVDLKEGVMEDVLKAAKAIGRKLLAVIKPWARGYDRKLKDLNNRIAQL